MPQNYFNLNCRAALLAAIAAAYPAIVYSAPAAQVDFAVGNVTAVGANGQSRNLGKGAQIEQGDTVNTNGGRAQLRFTDGAYVSLQPESQFRIDQYRYDGKQDGNEKGFFSLLKGGLRTITGLVGRTNKANYQVQTSVATIGIRGTEYTIEYGHSVIGTVGEGQIEVCNGGGCLSVTNGESYYVQGQEVKPVLTNKRTDLPAPPPQNPPPAFKQNENVDDAGINCNFSNCTQALLTGSGNFHVGYATQFGGTDVEEQQPTVLDNGQLVSFTRFGSVSAVSGPYSDVGGDDIIVWGRAASFSGGEALHYVVGIPTDMGTISNMQGTYVLLGATSPTGTSDGKVGGILTDMSMTADFSTGSVSGSMKWTLESKPIAANFNGSFDGPIFANGSTDGSGSVSMQGFVAGANAARAGFVYSVNDIRLTQSYVGAAALKQTSLTVAPLR